MKNEISVIGAFYGNAGKVRGAEEGGRMIKSYIMDRYDVRDGGDVDGYGDHSKRGEDCLQEVISVCKGVKELVGTSLENSGKAYIIGGDHSISLGSISAAAVNAKNKGEKFGVIYIDAHGDINTLEESLTKNIHGTTLAASMGTGDGRMTALATAPLLPENLLFIGTRSLEEFEKNLIERKGITTITAEHVRPRESDLGTILNEIKEFVDSRGLETIHLSIDIDSVDPMEAPGTGVPEINGISASTVKSIVDFILTETNVKSVDFVEFNPLLDKDDKTLTISKEISNLIVEKL